MVDSEKSKGRQSNDISSFQRHAAGMMLALIIQYFLGIATNLFVSFPQTENSKTLWEFAGHQVLITAHIAVGIALLLGTVALLIRAIIVKYTVWITPASFAVGFVVIAALTGVIFIPTQQDVYSIIMAISFIGALLSYFWGIYKAK